MNDQKQEFAQNRFFIHSAVAGRGGNIATHCKMADVALHSNFPCHSNCFPAGHKMQEPASRCMFLCKREARSLVFHSLDDF